MNPIAKSFLCFASIASLVQPSLRAEGELTAPQPPLLIRGDAAHAEVKCRLSGGWLLVPLEIDGAKAWFKLGTGWGTTQVDRKFINAAKLTPLPRLGLLQKSTRTTASSDSNPTHVRFTIDYTVPLVTWHRAGAFKAPENAEKLMLREGASFPVVQCAVGKANGWAVINTATQILEVARGLVNLNPETIQLLLKARAKATGTDYRGTGTLACAARGRQPAGVVKLLLDAGAEVDRMDANDITPLMAFARLGDIASCEVLLDAGADVNATSMMSASAITQAANSFLCREEQAAAMVTFLKSRGAKLTESGYEIAGPLAGAIGSGRAAVVESVIKAGGDPNQDLGTGLRPLHLAAAASNRAVVAKLIDLGADLKALDKASVSVLGHAAAAGRTDIIDFLLERGLPPDGPDASVVPLGLAVEGRQLAAVRQLLAAGAKPNARFPKTGKTFLQVSTGDPQIREVLLAAGARED